jgi:DNA-directed RNA polymerase subunit beta'
MGGESVREMLRKIDCEYLSRKLRMELKETKSEAGTKKLSKRLKVVEAFKG